jgi:hypothetical protein
MSKSIHESFQAEGSNSKTIETQNTLNPNLNRDLAKDNLVNALIFQDAINERREKIRVKKEGYQVTLGF